MKASCCDLMVAIWADKSLSWYYPIEYGFCIGKMWIFKNSREINLIEDYDKRRVDLRKKATSQTNDRPFWILESLDDFTR